MSSQSPSKIPRKRCGNKLKIKPDITVWLNVVDIHVLRDPRDTMLCRPESLTQTTIHIHQTM